MKVVWLRRALTEHRSLVAFIAADNPRAAVEQGDRIVAAANALSDNPDRGRPGRVAGTRELVVPRTSHIIVYRTARGRIEILRVLHGAQRWPPA